MTTPILFGIAVLAVVIGILVFRTIPAVQTYFTYRGKRLIPCPETHKTAAVDVAARKAAATAFMGNPTLRLDQCSRWPARIAAKNACSRLRLIRTTG